jgi:hypothetical protein
MVPDNDFVVVLHVALEDRDVAARRLPIGASACVAAAGIECAVVRVEIGITGVTQITATVFFEIRVRRRRLIS